jgi:hypothetical protein
MSKDYSDRAWAEEFDQSGAIPALTSRLRFHGVLDVAYVTRMTGRAQNTVKRWFDRLVATGIAKQEKIDSIRLM